MMTTLEWIHMLTILLKLGVELPNLITDVTAAVAAYRAAGGAEDELKAGIDGLKKLLSDIESAI